MELIVKDWDACDLRVALAYPDVYDIGMSNMGLGILYDIVNRREGMLAERVFAPWADMEATCGRGRPAVEPRDAAPAREFDVLGFSLSYEGTYTNILNMLDLAGMPVRAEERDRRAPAGHLRRLRRAQSGRARRLRRCLRARRRRGDDRRHGRLRARVEAPGPRHARRAAAAPGEIWGMYVPRFYTPEYNADGTHRRGRADRDGAAARA